ncbi:MAG: response regulator [Halanaerobiales bacterium]
MRILIADDHPLYTEGLKNFLEDDFEITGIVEDGKTAVKEALSSKPDVILMDIKMPVIDGIEATRLIKEELPDSKIIILTSFEREDSIIKAIEAGASGYLLKSLDGEQLIQNLKEMEQGKSPFSPGLEGFLLQNIRKSGDAETEKEEKKFTARQIDVIKLLVKGYTYKEIAGQLYLSERTVKYHMKKIKEKLGVETRRDVIKYISSKYDINIASINVDKSEM